MSASQKGCISIVWLAWGVLAWIPTFPDPTMLLMGIAISQMWFIAFLQGKKKEQL